MCVCVLVKLIEAFLESKKEHVGGIFIISYFSPISYSYPRTHASLIIVF